MNWFKRLSNTNSKDFSLIPDAVDYYDALYIEMRKHLDVKGGLIVEAAANLAGLAETVAATWSEIKAICDLIELRRDAATSVARDQYIKTYPKHLSIGQYEKFAETDENVIVISEILIQMKYQLNKWESLSKGVAQLSFQIKLIGDMRRASMDDATL